MVGSGVSKSNERNDHLRNDHKSQDGIGTGESNPGCRPRTSKEAVHENVSLDRKLDGADPISGKYFRRYFLLPLTDQFFTDLYRELFILLSDVLLLVPIIYLAVYALKGNDQLSTTIVRFPVDGNVYEVIALCSCLRLERSSFHGIVLFVVVSLQKRTIRWDRDFGYSRSNIRRKCVDFQRNGIRSVSIPRTFLLYQVR